MIVCFLFSCFLCFFFFNYYAFFCGGLFVSCLPVCLREREGVEFMGGKMGGDRNGKP